MACFSYRLHRMAEDFFQRNSFYHDRLHLSHMITNFFHLLNYYYPYITAHCGRITPQSNCYIVAFTFFIRFLLVMILQYSFYFL